MTPQVLRARLLMRGYTLSDISRRCRVSTSMVSQVLGGTKGYHPVARPRSSNRIQLAIADAAELTLAEAFPDAIPPENEEQP